MVVQVQFLLHKSINSPSNMSGKQPQNNCNIPNYHQQSSNRTHQKSCNIGEKSESKKKPIPKITQGLKTKRKQKRPIFRFLKKWRKKDKTEIRCTLKSSKKESKAESKDDVEGLQTILNCTQHVEDEKKKIKATKK